ncbi:MAG: hypothetical protein M5R36_13065 [Deltaproteobacteria bacterium]|nr:hypothetical protein [Deltaproteobacteria bacterium]
MITLKLVPMAVLLAAALAAARLFGTRSSRTAFAAGSALMALSLTGALADAWQWTHGGADEVLGPFSLLGLYLAPFILFMALRRAPAQPESAVANGALGLWLLVQLLFFTSIPRDYQTNVWLLDLGNRMIEGTVGLEEKAFLRAFGALNFLVATHFIALTAAGSMPVAYGAYRLVSAAFGRGSFIRLRDLSPPRWMAPLALGAGFLWLVTDRAVDAPAAAGAAFLVTRLLAGAYVFTRCSRSYAGSFGARGAGRWRRRPWRRRWYPGTPERSSR